MIASPEDSNPGCHKFLTREIILSIIALLLMATPCVLCFTWILSSED